MQWCDKCEISVRGTSRHCPLCQNELTSVDEEMETIYPLEYPTEVEKHMVIKVINFTMLVAGCLGIFINLLFPTKIWWGLILVIILIGARVSLSTAIAKHRNILKYLLHQSIIIIIIAMVIDVASGRHGWSLNFILPIIFTLAMLLMYLLSKILHLHVQDYMIYLLLDAVFGIIPIIFLLLDWVTSPIPSFVCVLTSVISVIGLISFEGPAMYSELKRRLHV